MGITLRHQEQIEKDLRSTEIGGNYSFIHFYLGTIWIRYTKIINFVVSYLILSLEEAYLHHNLGFSNPASKVCLTFNINSVVSQYCYLFRSVAPCTIKAKSFVMNPFSTV